MIMKKYVFGILLFANAANAQITNSSPYCAAIYSDDVMLVEHYISRVQFGALDNNSGTTQYTAPHYVYYNNLTTTVQRNQTMNLTLTHDDGVTIHGIAAWIDFNGDSDFDDAGEKVGETLFPGDGDLNTGNTVTYSVTIPSTAILGETRMRVRIYEDDDYTFSGTNLPVLPCQYNNTDYDWGETEDYNITITAPASLSDLAQSFAYSLKNNVFAYDGEVQKLQVIGLNGQVLSSTTTNQVDVTSLPSGIYLVQIIKLDNTSEQVKIAK